jgi:hypothetical protein
MPDFKQIDEHLAQGADANAKERVQIGEVAEAPDQEPRPSEVFKPFDDPAFSAAPAQPPVKATAPVPEKPAKDTGYAGHPDFSQDAAGNHPPKGGMGLTRPLGETSAQTRQSDSRGPSVAAPAELGSKKDADHRPL